MFLFLCLAVGAPTVSSATPTVTLTSPVNNCNTCGPQVELKATSNFAPLRWEVWLDGQKVYSAKSSGANFDQVITTTLGVRHRIVVSALGTNHSWCFATPVYVYAPQGLAITTTTMPPGYTNRSYSKQLTATGGTPPYTWSLPSGNLPPGLTLAATTGVVDGTPTQTGTYAFGVRITDSNGLTADSSQLTMAVHNSAITVRWLYNDAVDKFNVYRGTTAGGPYSLIGSTTVMSYTDRNFVAGNSYYFVVTAVVGGIETRFSDEIKAVTK